MLASAILCAPASNEERPGGIVCQAQRCTGARQGTGCSIPSTACRTNVFQDMVGEVQPLPRQPLALAKSVHQ